MILVLGAMARQVFRLGPIGIMLVAVIMPDPSCKTYRHEGIDRIGGR